MCDWIWLTVGVREEVEKGWKKNNNLLFSALLLATETASQIETASRTGTVWQTETASSTTETACLQVMQGVPEYFPDQLHKKNLK